MAERPAAAKVTRVGRLAAAPAAAAGAAAPPVEEPFAEPCTHAHGSVEGLDAAVMQSLLQGIVGQVQERHPAADEPPTPPVPASPAGAAFPAATHRKQSKFILTRQKQEPAAAAPASAAVAPAAAASPSDPARARPAVVQPAAAAAAGDDQAVIEAESRDILAHMSAEQLEEARREVLSRLKPSAVEFLRHRGQAKAAAPAPPLAQAVSPSEAAPAARMAPGGDAGHAGSSSAALAAAPRVEQHLHTAGPPTDAASNRVSAVGRLLFDISGHVVGLKALDPAAAAPAAPAAAALGAGAAVVRRDPLSTDMVAGGGAEQGQPAQPESYTLDEACLLTRSGLPQQRQLALRLLGAVLAQARPRGSHSSGPARPVPLPPDVTAELGGGDGQGAAPDWSAVWHYALHSAEVAMVLRVALDGAHQPVISAASEAVAALVGAAGPASLTEDATAEAADAHPLTGWPQIPFRHLQRLDRGGAWLAVPTLADVQHSAAGELFIGQAG